MQSRKNWLCLTILAILIICVNPWLLAAEMPINPEYTPEPQPTPRDTFCDIMITCGIYVYDGVAGESFPIEGAFIEPVSLTCPYDSWTTGSGGWATLQYANYNFDMDIRISHSGYYDSEHNISYSSCPLSVGLSPILTPTPPPYPRDGDVNLDDELSSEDAQMAFLIALGQMQGTTEQMLAADCNGDGSVTAADAQEIFIAVIQQGSCLDPID